MARKWSVFLRTVESFVLRLLCQLKLRITFQHWRYRRLVMLSLLGVLLVTAVMPPVLSQMPSVNRNNLSVEQARYLVEQGKKDYENGEFDKAIESLQQAKEKFEQQGEWGNLASTLSNIGLSKLELGQSSEAFKSWEEAEKYYTRVNNKVEIARSRVYQAQALQSLGLYFRACEILTTAVLPKALRCDALDDKVNQEGKDSKTSWDLLTEAIQKEDKSIRVIIWRSLGDVLCVIGDLDNSQKALKVAESLSSSKYLPAIHLSLANTLRAKGNLERDRKSSPVYEYIPWKYVKKEKFTDSDSEKSYGEAKEEYKSAIDSSSVSGFKFQAQLNFLSLLIERNEIIEAQKLLSQVYSKENNNFVSDKHKKKTGFYAKVNLAKSLAYLKQASENNKSWDKAPSWDEIIKLLKESQQEAKDLNSKRGQSYALGNLGGLYEYLGRLDEAQQMTQEALYLAQPSELPDIAYQWQWQMGRLLKAQSNKTEEAITSYEAAVNTLESVRGDLLAINADVQFSFRDNVEPLYRELVDLLLKREGTSTPSQDNLKKAIQKIDKLQLAELQNFLRCNLSNLVQVKQIKDPKAAIIYSIILKDRLATIYELPGEEKPFYREESNLLHSEIEKTLSSLRGYLIAPNKTPEVIHESAKLYQWIIKPLEEAFKQHHVETLVFVQDGYLRNIPMAVLYDEKQKQYLIEKDYAIALAPRIQLFSPELSQLTSSLSQQKLKVFIGGVGIPQEFNSTTFSEIHKLKEELEGIPKELTFSKPIMDKDFTKSNIQQRLKLGGFSAIHWKTHGVFSSDPNKTFIVAYKELIKAKDLNSLIQIGSKSGSTPIELLVLSACETAKGDNRAVLGLAGIAVRTGTRSVLSTLWTAQDEPNTKFMIRFYQELLKPGMTKAQAVRLAQIALKKEGYTTPYVWANYALIGNWL